MVLSKSQLRKISKKIRDGERNQEYIRAIEEYRDSRLPELYALLVDLSYLLENQPLPFLISGRPKRIKSIIRKLERGTATDISSIIDIIGTRIITDNLKSQFQILELIKGKFICINIKDYNDRVGGYRCIHMYVESDSGQIEVQIRTIMQQLWATESESLGERAKEGAGTKEQIDYLYKLSEACALLDNGEKNIAEIDGIGTYRGPIKGLLPKLKDNFYSVVKSPDDKFKYYLIIYDSFTNELLGQFDYSHKEKDIAIFDFCHKSRLLRQDRYDVLFLNSTGISALRVTHPNYFPM